MDLFDRTEQDRRRELLHLQRRERKRQRNETRRKQSEVCNERSSVAGSDRDRSILSNAPGELLQELDTSNICDPLRVAEEPQSCSNRNSCTGNNDDKHDFSMDLNATRSPTICWRRSTLLESQCARSRRRRKVTPSSSSPWWRQAFITGAIFLLALLPAALAGTPKYETAYACEGKTLMIECEPGDLINLIRANYGRFSITICNDHGNVDWSVNCMSPKSLRVLHSKCAQKQNCSVLASTSMFGDPCPGTHKYLEAHYQCVSAAQSSTTTNRPSPPWLKTSQPIVWSTSTVRSPVLSRLNLTTDLGGGEVAVVAAVTPALSTPPATLRPAGGGGGVGGNAGTKTSQSPTTFRNKGFENKSVNDDLAIIKTIADRKKGGGPVEPLGPRAPSGGTEDSAAPAGGAKEEEDDDGADLYPTQTAVLSGAAAPPGIVVRKDPVGTSVNGGGNVQIDISHACGPSSARNLFWNVTRVGEVNVQPCPGGATGIAKWRCVAIASLSPEQRVHLQQEHQQMLQIQQTAQQQQSGGTGGSGAPSADDSGSGKGDISFSSNSVALSDKQSMAGAATWYAYRPDLTQCRSLWLNNLEVRVQQPESSLISIANDLAQVTSSKTLYGGDMLVATKIIQTMSQKMHYDIETIPDQRQREALVFELLNSVVKTGSNLLDQSQHASWLDLSVEDQMRVATSLLTGLEDNAFLLADTILREKHVVQKVKNILLSIRVLETRNFAKSTELFPDSSTERWQVSNDQIELPKAALIENSEGGLVRIVFVAFDRLEQILRPQFSNIQQQQPASSGGVSSARAEPSQHRHLDTEGIASANVAGLGGGNLDRMGANDGTIGSSAAGGAGTRTDSTAQSDITVTPRLRLLNSKVISASLGKGRHIQLSQPIRMILRHLRTKNVSNPTCVFWNYIDHAWSEDGCHVEHTNSTHTVCMCNHLTNFALLVDAVDDETQLSLLSNLDDSLLLYIGIAVLVVIVVVALFARKLCHGAVLAKLRNGGPEASAGLRGGTIDRDPAGLSISAHHGTVAGRLHHHHGGSNNAGVDLHHPTIPTTGHHHHHLVHHHLPPPGTGHHLLVADDFHHQQQQQHPVNNLHNHHPNNLGSNHHANSNNLVTTTFNNLNGGGGIGPGNCSPSPPGSGYEHHHPAHHLARLNNNPIITHNNNSSSSTSSNSSSSTGSSNNLHHQPTHHLQQSSFSSNSTTTATTTTNRKLPQPPLVPSSYKGSVVMAAHHHHQHHL
ncbi:latrophilin Cirl [Anopheles marshallii]|uniref:latrophilin Cirl n=1 Tax=Anopheles marshallii TaxID=1521116 RepID=UPI00237A9CD0|nr:latrophilin Cirl [Anopheles marshallii]